MNFRLNSKSDLPIYGQIVERVRHAVATGELQPGQQLPTVRALAVELRVNANTVARAYDELDRAGVISTQQGRGTYIAERPDDAQLSAHRREALRAIVHRAVLQALSLGYSPDEVQATFDANLKRWRRELRASRRRPR
jgi:GntR family transcriptional regulator